MAGNRNRKKAYIIDDDIESTGPSKYSIPDLKQIKRGSRVWFELSDYDDTIGTGIVNEIYNFPESGICVSVWEEKFGSWRTYLASKVSLKKIRRKRKKKNIELDIEVSEIEL